MRRRGRKGKRKDAKRGTERTEERRDLDEVQEQKDMGKKAGKKGLFELSLCAKQLPGLSGRERRTVLCSFTCRPIADTVYRRIDISAETPSHRSLRVS